MGARPALAHHLPDGRLGGRGLVVVPGSGTGRGSGDSRSGRWSSRPGGRARPSRRRCCRSPSGWSASSRRRNHLDAVRSYTTAGQTTIFVDLEQSTPPCASRRRLVSGPQEHRRYPADAAGGRRRAVLQRRLRRHLRHHLRLHRRRLQLPRAARLRRGGALTPAARAGRRRRSRSSARRTSRSVIEFSTEKLAGLRLDYLDALSRRCRRRTSCGRPASSRPTRSACSCA